MKRHPSGIYLLFGRKKVELPTKYTPDALDNVFKELVFLRVSLATFVLEPLTSGIAFGDTIHEEGCSAVV